MRLAQSLAGQRGRLMRQLRGVGANVAPRAASCVGHAAQRAGVVMPPATPAATARVRAAAHRRLCVVASQTAPASTAAQGTKSTTPTNNNSGSSGYRVPPEEIRAIVDAPAQPSLSFSPDRSLILQLRRPPALPPIEELARPELKLGGVCTPRGNERLFSVAQSSSLLLRWIVGWVGVFGSAFSAP